MDYVIGSVAALISGNVTPNRPKHLKRAQTPIKHQPSPNVTPKSEFLEDRSIFLSPTMQKKKAIVKKSPKRIFQNPDPDVTNGDEDSSPVSPMAEKVRKHLKNDLDALKPANSPAQESPKNNDKSPKKANKKRLSGNLNVTTPKKKQRLSESGNDEENNKLTSVSTDISPTKQSAESNNAKKGNKQSHNSFTVEPINTSTDVNDESTTNNTNASPKKKNNRRNKSKNKNNSQIESPSNKNSTSVLNTESNEVEESKIIEINTSAVLTPNQSPKKKNKKQKKLNQMNSTEATKSDEIITSVNDINNTDAPSASNQNKKKKNRKKNKSKVNQIKNKLESTNVDTVTKMDVDSESENDVENEVDTNASTEKQSSKKKTKKSKHNESVEEVKSSDNDTVSVNPNAVTNEDTDSEHDSDDEIESESEEINKKALDTDLADNSSDEESEEPKQKTDKKPDATSADGNTRDLDDEAKRTLFVGNVPFSSKCKKEIKKIFDKHGKIETVRIRTVPVKDARDTPKLAVIKNELHPDMDAVNVYIKFAEADSVQKALVENNTVLNGKHLRVQPSDTSGVPHDVRCSVFVGNLPFAVQDEMLREKFSRCGEIDSVRIIRDKKTCIGKGFGYVNFKSKDAVELALALADEDLTIKNRIVRVKRCTQQTQNQLGKKEFNRHRQLGKQDSGHLAKGNFGGRQNDRPGNRDNFRRQENQDNKFGGRQNDRPGNRDNFRRQENQGNKFGGRQNDRPGNRDNFRRQENQGNKFGGRQNDRFGNRDNFKRQENQGNRGNFSGQKIGDDDNYTGAYRRIMNKRQNQDMGEGPPNKKPNLDQPPREKKEKKEFVGMTAEKKKKNKFSKDLKKKKALSEILTKFT